MYRPLPPVLFLVCLIAALLLHGFTPIARWTEPALIWLGGVALAAGLGLAIAGSQRFARAGTNIHTFRPPDVLVTDGLFAVSRNPMYLGFLAALAGVCLLLGSLSPWLTPLAFFAVAESWYIPYEEQACSARFGADYTAYRARTRRWL